MQSAYYDTEKDIVQLQADPRLFELYQFDRKVLLQLKAINALKRRESAQSPLYLYRESAPGSGTDISGASAGPPEPEIPCVLAEPDGEACHGAAPGDWLSGLHGDPAGTH